MGPKWNIWLSEEIKFCYVHEKFPQDGQSPKLFFLHFICLQIKRVVLDVDPIGFNVFYIVPDKTHFFNTSVFWDIAAKKKLGRLSLFPWRNILPSLSQTTFLHTTSRRQYKAKHSSYKYILTVFSAFLLKMGAF